MHREYERALPVCGAHNLGQALTGQAPLTALASMPKDHLDDIRNALDVMVECPPTEFQFAEIKAARESSLSAAIAAPAPSKGSLTNWTIEVGEIADLQRHQESNREGGCINAGSDQEQKVLHVPPLGPRLENESF